MAESIWDLERNDVPACVSYYEKFGVTRDEVSVMIQLQDDPAELLEIVKGWKSREQPRK